MANQNRELPIGYTRCAYLENSGTQWIDTGIAINGTHKLNISFLLTKIPNKFVRIFGGRVGYLENAFFLAVTADNIFRFDYGSQVYFIQDVSQNEKYDVSIGDGTFKINDYIINYKDDFFAPRANYYIFYGNLLNDENFAQIPYMKLYSFEIKDTISLLPSLDPSGRPCMFDTVTRQPFYNQGQGEFGYELMDGTYVAPV